MYTNHIALVLNPLNLNEYYKTLVSFLEYLHLTYPEIGFQWCYEMTSALWEKEHGDEASALQCVDKVNAIFDMFEVLDENRNIVKVPLEHMDILTTFFYGARPKFGKHATFVKDDKQGFKLVFSPGEAAEFADPEVWRSYSVIAFLPNLLPIAPPNKPKTKKVQDEPIDGARLVNLAGNINRANFEVAINFAANPRGGF